MSWERLLKGWGSRGLAMDSLEQRPHPVTLAKVSVGRYSPWWYALDCLGCLVGESVVDTGLLPQTIKSLLFVLSSWVMIDSISFPIPTTLPVQLSLSKLQSTPPTIPIYLSKMPSSSSHHHRARPARRTVTVWHCCGCGMGAMLCATTPSCTNCGRQRCNYCQVYTQGVTGG